ncbi:ATP-binding protein [bacterium]|nr:ATP-binding protein [bacterium]
MILQSYQIKIPAKTGNLEVIRNFLISSLQTLKFSEEELNKVLLSVDEACSNVIRHAYNFKENQIKIDLKIEKNKISIFVTDSGKGFDPSKIETPKMDEYLKNFKVGGLGILIMKKLMDEVEYDIRPGSQNKVKLVKYF